MSEHLVEIFQPIIIDGKETDFLISDYGKCINKYTGEERNPHYDKKGRAMLSINGTRHTRARFMAMAFLDPPDGDIKHYDADHIDEDRTNDCINNIAWLTRKENVRKHYDLKIDTHRGENNHFHKLTGNDVDNIYLLAINDGLRPKEIADNYGVEKSTIAKILRGEHWPEYREKYKEQMKNYKPGHGVRRSVDQETIDKIKSLHNEGFTAKRILKELDLNFSESYIIKIINKY